MIFCFQMLFSSFLNAILVTQAVFSLRPSLDYADNINTTLLSEWVKNRWQL